MYAEMSYPFYRCTSTSFFSVSRGKGNANSERREGIMAIPMRRPRCAFEAYVVASFSAGICNTDGGSDTTSSSCSSSCSRSLNTISPFNRHRLRSRFSLLFPLPPRVYVHQPPPVPVGAPRPLFSFLSSFARGDREDGYSETTEEEEEEGFIRSDSSLPDWKYRTNRVSTFFAFPPSFVRSSANGCLPLSCLHPQISFE